MALKYPCYWIRKDNAGEWRWTYYAVNGEEIAVSSEGYKKYSDCEHGVNLVKASANHQVFFTPED